MRQHLRQSSEQSRSTEQRADRDPMRFGWHGLALAWLAAFAVPCRVPAQQGAFKGEVKDSATWTPLSGLKVYLLNDHQQRVGSTLTDARGLFVVPHPTAGIFQLQFDRPGMKSVFGPVDTVSADSVISRSYSATFVANPLGEYQVDEPARELPGVQGPPRYPRSLERASLQGSVKVSFVVDTTGHVDMKSVKLIRSSDIAFYKAVMDALPHIMYIPARFRGQKTPQRVEQTFDFKPPLGR